jgi:hypothetical protein
MAKCKQCGKEYEAKRSTSSYCSPKCKQTVYRNRIPEPVTLSVTEPVTVTAAPNNLVGQCIERAKTKLPWRKGDPVWPYTRHLKPVQFVAWCRLHRPSWLTPAKPGDDDYNWDESSVPHLRAC